MQGKLRAVGLVGLVTAAGLLTAWTASAAPAPAASRGPACGPNMIRRDIPSSWPLDRPPSATGGSNGTRSASGTATTTTASATGRSMSFGRPRNAFPAAPTAAVRNVRAGNA